MALSLHRHATSKIKSQADLFRIRTLGFRGEAIPSIASISHFTVKTATADEHYGTLLVAKGARLSDKKQFQHLSGQKLPLKIFLQHSCSSQIYEELAIRVGSYR